MSFIHPTKSLADPMPMPVDRFLGPVFFSVRGNALTTVDDDAGDSESPTY
jgi:hypothetical protein